jgi:NAD+ diphosphatase
MHSDFSPSEVFRYCPKCGNPGFLPDTEKSMKCNSCGFRYFINMSASVAAIIRNEKNEILFTVRKYDPAAGMLDLPGGFVDLGETAEDAVKREIFEELNLKVNKTEFVGTFTNKYQYAGIEYQTLDLVFNCLVESFEKLKVADDVSGYFFRDLAGLKHEEIGLESIREIADYILRHS